MADLCTSNSPVGVGTPIPSTLVDFSPPHSRGLSDVQTQFDASAAAQPLAVSLLDCNTGDSPTLAPCIGFVPALSACNAPLAVATSAPIVAARGRPGALGSVGYADTVSRRNYRARDLLC